MFFSKLSNIIFLYLITFILVEETEDSKEFCSLFLECDKCKLCDVYSECGFSSILCQEQRSMNYNLSWELHANLTSYYKSDEDMVSFCNSRNFTLNEATDSFTIFQSNPNVLSGTLTKSYHCEYYIKNSYYLLHDTDDAVLNFELKDKNGNKPKNSKLEFLLLYIYNADNKWQFIHLDENDQNIRSGSISRSLTKISEFQILIDFNNNNTYFEEGESLVISISTDNPSEKLRIIYIVIIVMICVFILVVIGLILLYLIMKKKLLEERERAIREEEEKKEKIIQKVELFLKEELKPQIFTDKLNIHGCDSCSICCDTFIKGTSQVSITPCSHIFHHECLEKWIKEKITNPHCPNCMQSFLEYIDNPMKIKIKKKVGFINNNLDENKNVSDKNGNIYEVEVKEEIGVNSHDDIPPSEQMRINNLNNLTNQKEKNEDIKSDKEKSINISINESNNNEA